MRTRLSRAGNSQGIVLPKKLLQQYQLSGEVELHPTPESLLITPVARPAELGSPDASCRSGRAGAGE